MIVVVPSPAVPLFTQQQIAKRAPALASVPARIPAGYRYERWTYRTLLRIRFRNAAGDTVVFVASRQTGACAAGREKTFQLAGNTVYWAQRAEQQEAWRCVDGVRLAATTRQPANAFADVGLGRVAASAHRIR